MADFFSLLKEAILIFGYNGVEYNYMYHTDAYCIYMLY